MYDPLYLLLVEMDDLVQMGRLIIGVSGKFHVVNGLSFQDLSRILLALVVRVPSVRPAKDYVDDIQDCDVAYVLPIDADLKGFLGCGPIGWSPLLRSFGADDHPLDELLEIITLDRGLYLPPKIKAVGGDMVMVLVKLAKLDPISAVEIFLEESGR